MKRCTTCGLEKTEGAFEMQPSRGRLRAECRECRRIAGRAWLARRKMNPPQPKVQTKRCKRCQEVKPTSEFSPSNPGYFHARCKACEVALDQEKRQEQYRNDPTGRFYRPFFNEAGALVKRCTYCHAEKSVSEYYRNGWERSKGDRAGRFHGKCKVCDKAIKKADYDAHPEKYRETVRRSAHKHPDRVRARLHRWKSANRTYLLQHYRAYNETHREERRTYNRSTRRRQLARIWDKAHPEIGVDKQHRRRARKRNAPRIEKIDRIAIIERDNWTCYLCEQVCTSQNVTLDHVIPLFRGGTHTADNLRVACSSCNSRKGTKHLKDFLK